MPAAEPEEAQICCLRIAHELHASLIGACTIAQLQIANAVAIDNDILELTPILAPQLLTLAERASLDELVGARDAGRRFGVRLPMTKTESDGLVRSFIPIWDARADATNAYRCVVRLPADDPAVLTPNASVALKVALAALENSIAALQAGRARGENFIVHVRVPFEALASPASRMEFTSACRWLSHELRPGLFFEIAELPIGVPQPRLNDLVETMRAFGRGVTAEVALRNPDAWHVSGDRAACDRPQPLGAAGFAHHDGNRAARRQRAAPRAARVPERSAQRRARSIRARCRHTVDVRTRDRGRDGQAPPDESSLYESNIPACAQGHGLTARLRKN